MAKRRTAKQRAASVKNLVAARRKRRKAISSVTSKKVGNIRINTRPGPVSNMSKSPIRSQRRKLGTYTVRNTSNGTLKRVGYKTYRKAKRQDAVYSLRASLSPTARRSKRQTYSAKLNGASTIKKMRRNASALHISVKTDSGNAAFRLHAPTAKSRARAIRGQERRKRIRSTLRLKG